MDQAISSGGKVHVHCEQGISRSSSMTIAYFMYKNRMTFKQAWDFVRVRHPPAYPNDGFIKQLKMYEQELGLSQ